jgi:twitching motility protein PilT
MDSGNMNSDNQNLTNNGTAAGVPSNNGVVANAAVTAAQVAQETVNTQPVAVPTQAKETEPKQEIKLPEEMIAAEKAKEMAPASVPLSTDVVIETLLEECIKHSASDLHLQAGLPPVLRIDGVLRPMTTYPILDDMTVQQLVFSTLDANQKVILKKDKEFDYSFAFGDLGRFRVNAFYERGNMAAAFRLIPNTIRSIEDLGLPGVVATFAEKPNGLVLVTGPTGSGKSTTLAALIDKINTEKALHIITIEDPIEFTHRSKRSVVAQREVHYDTFSFAAALRSILREDPDVVLIGEMRDLETIQAAITVAETGHLVFATLHTNSAAQSIDRMIDVFPAHQQPQIRAQLANILVGICSQRLVPAVDGGRIAVTEILVTNSAVRSIIREGKTHQLDMTIQTGMSQGMQTMDRELARLVNAGVINFDVARGVAVDTTEFDRLARG